MAGDDKVNQDEIWDLTTKQDDAVVPLYVPGHYVHGGCGKWLPLEQKANLELHIAKLKKETGVEVHIFFCVGKDISTEEIAKIEAKSLESLGYIGGSHRVAIFFYLRTNNGPGTFNCDVDRKIFPDTTSMPEVFQKEILSEAIKSVDAFVAKKGKITVNDVAGLFLDTFQEILPQFHPVVSPSRLVSN